MRSRYDQRRQVLVQALKAHFGDRVKVLGEKAGLHIMVRMNIDLDDEEIIRRAASNGIGLMSARPCYLISSYLISSCNSSCNSEINSDLKAERSCEFIFGYSELDETQIQAGISRLAKALELKH